MTDKENAELLQQARDFASQDVDLYAELSVDVTATKENIHRAWRKTSLKYHPDKTGAAFDAEKYEKYERYRNVLTEPAARAAYDQARGASLLRKRERERMNSKRRAMLDDLEAREGEAKRQRQEADEKARELDRERARMVEENRVLLEQRDRERRREAEARESKPAYDALDEREADLLRQIDERRAQKKAKKAEKKARRRGLPTDIPETSTPTNGSESQPPPPPSAYQRQRPKQPLWDHWLQVKATVLAKVAAQPGGPEKIAAAEQRAAEHREAVAARSPVPEEEGWRAPRPFPRFESAPNKNFIQKPRIVVD